MAGKVEPNVSLNLSTLDEDKEAAMACSSGSSEKIRPDHNSSTTTIKDETTTKGEKNEKKEDGEEEFTIAADLTLYANPLRCLKKTAKPPIQHSTSGTDMVAADLVKYGSPLDDNPVSSQE